MKSPLNSVPAALAVALVLGAPRTVAACFDEYVTEVGPVRIAVTYHGENGGHLGCRSERTPCSTWAARLAQLLPGGSRLEIRSGDEITKQAANGVEIELCLPGRRCRLTVTEHHEIAEIFDEIAARLEPPPARRARVRSSRPAYFTLQAGAFARAESAQALAERIDGETGGVGANRAYGHPGPTEASWVEEETLAGGRRVFRVMAGTFPGHAYAARARARVAAVTGETPLVRPIGAD